MNSEEKIFTVEELIKLNIIEKPLDGNHGGLHPTSNDYVPEGIPFLMASDIKEGKINFDECKRLSQTSVNKLKKGFAKNGDVLLTHKATLGRTALLNNTNYEYVVLSPQVTFYRVKNTNILDRHYLRYYFESKSFQDSLHSFGSSGSTRAYVGITAQLKLPLYLPEIRIQKRIAHILSTLDKKIEINQKINQTLESIEQTIFKSWFIDFDPVHAKMNASSEDDYDTIAKELGISREILDLFPNEFEESEQGLIPKGWKIKSLDQIANFQNGLALQKFRPKGNEYLPVLKIAQLKRGFCDDEEKADINIKEECIVNSGDVIFSWSGSLMVDIWCSGKAALNQHLFKVTSRKFPKWVYYYWVKEHLKKFQTIAADKAVTMGHIKRSHLTEAKCLIPPEKLLSKANIIIQPFIDSLICNRLANSSLEKCKNNLLPKLLSGEIEVSTLNLEPEHD